MAHGSMLIASALGIGAASFWRRKLETEAEAGDVKRYSGKPDGGAGTPKKELQNIIISKLSEVKKKVHHFISSNPSNPLTPLKKLRF